MATEEWAKEIEGTGLTINTVNAGASANTPGMAEEMREMSREGRAPPSPTRWSRRSSTSSRARLIASTAGASTPTCGIRHCRPAEAAHPAGFELHA
jgi:NAD(P)-dependent dehydrogenase (short-subunit alcohol dehydrogenase family)